MVPPAGGSIGLGARPDYEQETGSYRRWYTRT